MYIRFFSSGQGQYGERDLVLHAEDYVSCAAVYPINFVYPEVVFAFYNGVTTQMEDSLKKKRVTVLGEVVSVNSDVEHKVTPLNQNIENYYGNEKTKMKTPASSVTGATPASSVTGATPASSVTGATPASSVTGATPASSVTGATPASSVTGATPASSVTGATPASSVTGATPASSVTGATPASSVTGATPASSVTGATPASSVTGATPASSVTAQLLLVV